MSFNLPKILHAWDFVSDWGSLWAYSLYYYDGENGSLILNMFNGTHELFWNKAKTNWKRQKGWSQKHVLRTSNLGFSSRTGESSFSFHADSSPYTGLPFLLTDGVLGNITQKYHNRVTVQTKNRFLKFQTLEALTNMFESKEPDPELESFLKIQNKLLIGSYVPTKKLSSWRNFAYWKWKILCSVSSRNKYCLTLFTLNRWFR